MKVHSKEFFKNHFVATLYSLYINYIVCSSVARSNLSDVFEMRKQYLFRLALDPFAKQTTAHMFAQRSFTELQ